MIILELNTELLKCYTLVVKVVNFKENMPIENVNVKIFRLENSITLEQWAENLKNGTPFKELVLSMNTDKKGTVTGKLSEGTYQAKVERYQFSKDLILTKNVEVLVIEPKKLWWK